MLKKVLGVLKKIILWFFAISIGLTIVYRFIPVPFTPLMVIRCVEKIADGEKPKWNYSWRSLEKISKDMPLAVIGSEDQKFPVHNGFDMEAIKKAMKNNEKGRKIKGGSTISQQTAKNVFLWQGRNWVRKGFEVYFTFLIETLWPKERIIEVYLNVIEMGDGIYGTQAAAQAYFKKDAANLSASQCALIAACLPNPRKYNAGNPSGYVKKRQRWIQRQMRNLRGTELY